MDLPANDCVQITPLLDAQRIWDRMLLHTFIRDFNSKYRTTVRTLVSNFSMATGQGIEGLKRVPSFAFDSMTVSRFVCGHLPRLATIVIDKEKTEDDVEDLVEKLQRWSIDTVVDKKAVAERNYFTRDRDAYKYSRKVTSEAAGKSRDYSGFLSAHRVKAVPIR